LRQTIEHVKVTVQFIVTL